MRTMRYSLIVMVSAFALALGVIFTVPTAGPPLMKEHAKVDPSQAPSGNWFDGVVDWLAKNWPLGPAPWEPTSDNTPPAQATFTSQPPASPTTTTNPVTFSWSAVESGATYLCKWDTEAQYACTSPQVRGDLGNGDHSFTVWAVDAAGNVGAQRKRAFTILETAAACTGTSVDADTQNLTTVTAAQPAGTTFCLQSGDTFTISQTVQLQDGDVLACDQKAALTSATIPSGATVSWPDNPTCDITDGANNLFRIVGGTGDVTIRDVEIYGADHDTSGPLGWNAGTGCGLNMGDIAPTSTTIRVEIRANSGNGACNFNGHGINLNVHDNGKEPAALGHIAGGIKCVRECEVRNSFIVDNDGVGVWCDSGCDPRSDTDMPNGFWVHDNFIANSSQSNIRYENSPKLVNPDNQVFPEPDGLMEDNRLAGGGYAPKGPRADLTVQDAQNGTVSTNTLGAVTFDGISYPNAVLNSGVPNGIVASWASDQSDRTDLNNIHIENNHMNGEKITGCNKQDTDNIPGGTLVFCSGNN